MEKFICIHGHFYQPPRENPWIEDVEVEDSAYPYHDWNARVTAECYAPNAASRILDGNRKIIDIVNNYKTISFNFGPTLLTWLERNNPQVYSALLDADKESLRRFSGHGSAIAQGYNHIIMPLANQRDKRTQIIWGIQDFVHRFGRFPEGMWLPETAVDLETLEMLADQGILFTILSPAQVSRVKKISETRWTEAGRETLDCSMPYTCRLPNKKSISLFILDEGIGQELAFGHLLENGDRFANRMVQSFSRYPAGSGITCVVSDGETFGHHHRFADMALAYALYLIDETKPAAITIFGEYLASHPPTHEIEIKENTSWSCPHGIERWRDDCGCSTAGTTIRDTDSHPIDPTRPHGRAAEHGSFPSGWKQAWRRPLRKAMDWLRDELVPMYENRMSRFVSDPWNARDDYIRVILDRAPEIREQFFVRHAIRTLAEEEKCEILKLLEMQRHAMLMYTSCGWFFDDISGIESIQVLQYACRAMQLAREVTGIDHEPVFISYLLEAQSNIPEHGDGAAIYRNYVLRSMIDLNRIVFNYALSLLITDKPDTPFIRYYKKLAESSKETAWGVRRMVTGTLALRSEITGEEKILEYAVIHLGTYEFMGGIRGFYDEASFEHMQDYLATALRQPDIKTLVNSLESEFGTSTYSLWHLFKDGQRKTLFRLLESTLEDLESSFRQIYQQQIQLIHAMREMQIPVPKVFEDPVWYILNEDLNNALSDEETDLRKIQHLINEMIHGQFSPDRSTLNFTASNRITILTKKFASESDDISAMQEIIDLFKSLAPLSLDYDLWECQNAYFYCGKKQKAFMQRRAGLGDSRAAGWISHFDELGTWLGVKSDE